MINRKKNPLGGSTHVKVNGSRPKAIKVNIITEGIKQGRVGWFWCEQCNQSRNHKIEGFNTECCTCLILNNLPPKLQLNQLIGDQKSINLDFFMI